MALESDILPLLQAKEEDESMDHNEGGLEMPEFEDDADPLMTSDSNMQPTNDEGNGAFDPEPDDGEETTEQFLTISHGVNQISVNNDGSIVYGDQGLSQNNNTLSQQINDSSLVTSLGGNTYYMQSQGELDDSMEEDMVSAQDIDDVSEYSGNTFLYNKSDGTLTQVSTSSNQLALNAATVLNRGQVKNILSLQSHPQVHAIKRPALVSPSNLKPIGKKVFIQSTPKGSPISKIAGTRTISMSEAQRLGLLKSGQNRVIVKKVNQGVLSNSGAGSGIVIRQPSKIMPRPIISTAVKPQAYRTVASSSQIKPLLTSTIAQQQRPIAVNKTMAGLTVAGRQSQKIIIRPNTGIVKTMQIGGKQQLVKIVSGSSISTPKLSALGNATFIKKSTLIGKPLTFTADNKVSSLLKSNLVTAKKTVRPDIEFISDDPTIIKVEDGTSSQTHNVAHSNEQHAMLDDIENDPGDRVPDNDGLDDDPQKLLEANGIRPKKPCNCTRSQCLKLYCECFANGEFCFECNCTNCYNNIQHEEDRQVSIKACLDRNPDAFRRKMQVATACSDSEEEKERRHNRGCNCKKSHCLKNYCECFEGKLTCCKSCKCISCRNTEEDMAAWMRGETVESGDESRDVSNRAKSFMPKAFAEALCNCIVVQAEYADKANEDSVTTERRIIEELGQRLVQIIGNRKVKESR